MTSHWNAIANVAGRGGLVLRPINWVVQVVSTLGVLWMLWRAAHGGLSTGSFVIVFGLVLLSVFIQMLVFRQERDRKARAQGLPPGRLQ